MATTKATSFRALRGLATDTATSLRKRPRPGETAIQSFLFVCGAISIFTTVGIIYVLGHESLLFFSSPDVSLVEFFTSTRWQPAILEFGILPLLNATLMTSGIALLVVFGRQVLLVKPLVTVMLSFTDTFAGVVVGMLFVSLPFLVNAARESFEMVDPELERMAETQGATSWQAFWLVALPLALRGILAGALLMWGRAISEFGAVVILAYHPKTVPVLVFERFEGFGLAAAQPVAVLLIIASLAVFVLLQTLVVPPRDGRHSNL